LPVAGCRLTLKLFSDVLVIEVWDAAEHRPIEVTCADTLAESGRGLGIVDALTVAPLMTFGGRGIGKTVVAVLALSR